MVVTVVYEHRVRAGLRVVRDRAERPSDQPGTNDQPPATRNELSEATLAALWEGQRFPAAALVTGDGQPLRVLHPGRRGRGAGPDFRDAIIAQPSGRVLRGDVELHVRASDFRAHGHQRDGRYNRVVLHVVFDDDTGGPTRLPNGRAVPVAALGSWVRRRADELAGWLRSPSFWREPCHDAQTRLGNENVQDVLEGLGDCRFERRADALRDDSARHGSGEAFYRALLAILGAGGDRGLFCDFAERLPLRELLTALDRLPDGDRVDGAEAIVLGAAGLGADRTGAPPPARATRPANHPARRLAGLARLLVRHRIGTAGPDVAALDLNGPAKALIGGWTVPADAYWRRNIAPGLPAKRDAGALIGHGRAIELLTNAVLPWLAALGSHDDAVAARACYTRLPRPARYGALAFLETNLDVIALDARRQQGLLALYKEECTQGRCGRCPLS